MTAPHGTPGPDDGYVKYRCLHTPGPAPAHPDLTALDALRIRAVRRRAAWA